MLAAFDEFMQRMVVTHAAEFAEVGITMAQAKVLYVVAAAESLRMSELAARLGVGMSTVSGAADRLVDLGLLARRTDAADRRQVIVAVTADGAEVLERMRELNTHQMRELLERLSDGDLAVVERSIRILTAAARAASDQADQGGRTGRAESEGGPA